MSRVKDTTSRNGLPQPKRPPSSFSGFFSKILPSNRPEQGGTARIHDITGDSDTAYRDLGMNPNDLTGWNFARERQPRSGTPETSFGHPHRRGRSLSMQRGGSRGDDGPSRSPQKSLRAPSLDLPRPRELSRSIPPPQAQNQKPQPITKDEVSKMLKAKEDTRRRRRSLKESGDWLGVQGADPYSGEFAVLTPTETLSTDTTSPSTKKRLAGLSRKKKTAKLAYEQAKLEEETEKEKALVEKERSKLAKMEHAKDKLRRQQHEFATWNQHKQQWSSAAEPDLSPIAQSMNSCNVANSSNEAAAAGIPNFSRPSRSNGESVIGQLKPVELSGNAENTEPPKRERCIDPSTDTIVHRSLPSMGLPDIPKEAMGVLPPGLLSGAADTPPQRQKSEKHFLWARRRGMTDPGKLVKCANPVMINSSAGKTEEYLVSISTDPLPPMPRLQPQQDHFADLLIPDHHLHLAYLEQTERIENPLAPIKRNRSPITAATPMRGSRSEAQSKLVPMITTNLPGYRRSQSKPQRTVSNANAATAISFQSRLKRKMNSPSIHQRLIQIRSSSSQMRSIQALISPMQTQNTSQTHCHIDTDLSGDTPWSQNPRPLSTLQEVSTNQSVETLDAHPIITLNEQAERNPIESASTHTITITGFDPDPDPDPQHLQDGIQLRMESWGTGEGSAVETRGAPVTPSLQSGSLPCNALTTGTERTTTSSRPTSPAKDSESFVLDPETAETGIGSTDDLVTLETDPTTPPPGLRLSLTNALMKLVREKLEEVGVAMAAPQQQQQHEDNKGQTVQTKESKVTSETGLPRYQDNDTQVATHQRQAPGEHKETMIQEAARIAMQKSRAKEVMTTRSCTPSPWTPETQEFIPLDCKEDIPEDGVVGIGFPLIKIGSTDLEGSSQLELQGLQRVTHANYKENRKHGISNDNQNPESDTIVTILDFFVMVYLVLFGFACAWWIVVRPAFDTRSELWRRRRRRRSTWRDIGVFMGACLFCVAAVFGVMGGVRVGWWIAVWL
ncbi:hypothetical protein HD806DRAFT_314438 [Xylariaceae sp. AK1471]|nr:hypothetical protein HD806DRAFT_314438 [Xylariaceae sp. AK1471]